MQVLKAEVRQAILTAAIKVFCAEGFGAASLRKIAFEAGISTANLYNYFPSKVELFVAVATPLRCHLQRTLDDFQGSEHEADWHSAIFVEAVKKEVSNRLGIILSEHADEFILLIGACEGTPLECFREEMILNLAQNFSLDIGKGSGGAKIDPLKLQGLAAMLVDGMLRIVSTSNSKDEIKERVNLLMHYHISGIRGLMDQSVYISNNNE